MSQAQMTIKRYLHFGFNFGGAPLTKEFEQTFNIFADDWIRYSSHCWIAWTPHDPSIWFQSLKPIMRENDQLLILELTQHQHPIHGWMPNWIWDWLYKPRV